MENPKPIPGLKLPLGFRFHPTDEELLVHYLKRKVLSIPLPAPVVSDFDVFQTHPFHLPGDLKEKRYFFSKREGNLNKLSKIKIACNDFGYWKFNEKDQIIVIPGTNQVIGIKKSLVFYEGRIKTQWFMDQYCLVGSPFAANSPQRCMIEIEDWVVSRIYQKKSKAKNRGVKNRNKEENRGNSSIIMDIMMEDNNSSSNELGPPQPCSSSSDLLPFCNASASASAHAHAHAQLDDEEEEEEEACSSFFIKCS